MLAGILALAAALPLSAAPAADRHTAIRDFYFYPAASPDFNKLGGFTWPDVQALNAIVKVDVGGFSGEQKVDAFLVIFDENDVVLAKFKGKHMLPAGEHELVFSDCVSTAQFFGARTLRAVAEVSLKGVKPVQAETVFALTGPDPPDVDIISIDIYNAQGGDRRDNYFEPGDEFALEAVFEIGAIEGDAPPRIIVYGIMEEDSHLLDPEAEYQPYDVNWDSLVGEKRGGEFRLRAAGRLPYYFAEPYEYRHPFRIYIAVDFGAGARTFDYSRGYVQDNNVGDQRASDDLTTRLIELNRSYTWEIKRLRGEAPGIL